MAVPEPRPEPSACRHRRGRLHLRPDSRYYGVTWYSVTERWKAKVTRSKRAGGPYLARVRFCFRGAPPKETWCRVGDGKMQYIGYYDDEVAAAEAVDQYIRSSMPGMLAKLNFPTPAETARIDSVKHRFPPPRAVPPPRLDDSRYWAPPPREVAYYSEPRAHSPQAPGKVDVTCAEILTLLYNEMSSRAVVPRYQPHRPPAEAVYGPAPALREAMYRTSSAAEE